MLAISLRRDGAAVILQKISKLIECKQVKIIDALNSKIQKVIIFGK